jgi:hypothetical protein
MSGAPATTTIRSVGTAGQGLEGTVAPAAEAAYCESFLLPRFSAPAVTRSRRALPVSSFRNTSHQGSVSALVDHSTASSSLPCPAAISRNPRRGLASPGDPGGLPIYKDGLPAGGIGIEGDGHYTVDRDPDR